MNADDFKFQWQLDDGTNVTIRLIAPEDAEIEQDFVRSLSTQSRFYRFFTPLRELSPATLKKFTHNRFPTDMALIATTAIAGHETEIGVARFAPGSQPGWAEFAIVVADAWQGRGIATRLLQHLFGIAVHAGVEGVEGSVLSENSRMLKLAKELGFASRPDKNDARVTCLRKAL